MSDSSEPELAAVASPPPRTDLTYEMVADGDLIGSGNEAIVTRVALDGPEPPDTVAVKEPIAPTETLEQTTIDSFLNQAQTWQTLARRERKRQISSTDHIVGVIATGETLPWVAMEYMDAGSLADRLENSTTGLPVDEALWIAECLCKGLKLAHDHGVAHLDLKPANILFRKTPDNHWNVPKIADWGLARTLLNESGSMDAFSVEYAAPEQFDSEQFGTPDTYTDIYQLGAVLYALLTGKPPYTGTQASVMHDVISNEHPPPPSTHRSTLPAAIDDLVLKALHTNKTQRYNGAVELLEITINNWRSKENKSSTTPVNHLLTSKQKTGSTERTAIAEQPSTTEPAQQETWPTLQGNPARTGHVPAVTGAFQPVTQKCSFETGGNVESSPAVVNDTVYVGSDDNYLYAIDTDTGTEHWRFETGGSVESSPAVADGTAYVGSHDYSLYAIDTETGTEQWCFNTGGLVKSSPVVVDDTVYVGSRDGHLYAIDTDTGTEQWQFKLGIEYWHFRKGNPVISSPAVVDDTVYVGSHDHSLYAIDTDTGTKHWHFETDGRIRSSPAVVDGTVYVGSQDNHLYAIDARTGAMEWCLETDGSVRSSPAVVDDTVYTGSTDNHLYAIDAEIGTEQWCFETDYWITSSPGVAGDTVYVGSRDGHLYAIDTDTGTERWRFKTGSEIHSSPAVVDDTVYVGSNDNHLYAIG